MLLLHNMNTVIRLVLMGIMGVFICNIGLSPVYAQTVTATFQLKPASGTHKVNDKFTVQIQLKSTASKRVSYARSILTFDPTMLEVSDSVQHGSIFCNYPSDSANYIADNTQGLLMITGISSGTSSCAYPELTATPVTFAQVTFTAKKAGNADVSFIFNGQQGDNVSGIVDTNSPPQFIMTSPQDASFTITTSTTTTTPTPTEPPTTTPRPKPPKNLGVDPLYIIIGAAALAVVGLLLQRRRDVRRVVVTEA